MTNYEHLALSKTKKPQAASGLHQPCAVCCCHGKHIESTVPSDSQIKCGGRQMAPHENKLSPLDGSHKLQVTVIVTTSELSQFTYPYIMIVQRSSSRVNSSRELYCCWLLSYQLMPRIAISCLCLPKQFKAMQSAATRDKN